MSPESAAAAPVGLDDARTFCENKVSRGDIGLYYSLLFAPRARRRAAVPLYAFWLEVREINDECSDPGVARLKLAWWGEELREMTAGRARHPVAVALAPVVAAFRLPDEPFFELLGALTRHVATAHYPTFDALREHGTHTRGRLEALAARLAGYGDTEALERVVRLGALLELTGLLRDAGADARRARIYLPQDDMARFDVSADDFNAADAGGSLRALLAFEADRLRQELQCGTALLPRADRARLRSLVVAAELARALLERMRREPARALHGRVALAPLRQLWTAWRAAAGTVTP